MGSPVLAKIVEYYIEFLEQKTIASAPIDCDSRPKLWKRYVDDVLEVLKQAV